MTNETIKKTALHECHLKHSGKMIEFAGWELPVYYKGLIEEHEAVRNNAGLFDVSHMGEIIVTGKDSQDFVNYIITNDAKALTNNQVAYTFMCYPHGGIVDDILVYKYNEEHFLLVVNASNIQKDYEWLIGQKNNFDIKIDNVSENISQLALQGPYAQKILQKLTEFDLSKLKFFFFEENMEIGNIKAIVSRTGYTGEDGFEIYVDNKFACELFENILVAGEEYNIAPAGLGCRDTLRFEATLPLYGNELSNEITPIEAGLSMFVKLNKDNFLGKETLLKQKEEGPKRKIVGFEMLERAIPRNGYEVYCDGEKIGHVTTGYMSPTLQKNIGLALIDSDRSDLGNSIEILIRKKYYKATIISKRFYNKNYKK